MPTNVYKTVLVIKFTVSFSKYRNYVKYWMILVFLSMLLSKTRSPAVAEGPRDAGVPVEILSAAQM